MDSPDKKEMEEKIIDVIKDKGPRTGSELLDAVDKDALALWRACRLSKRLAIRIVGTRYLRFDRRIEGLARLSPSILREFLTYSIIGLDGDHDSLEARADDILLRVEEISRAKSDLAYSLVSTLAERLGNDMLISEHVCFIMAGDIVFNMAHDVPRQERSTGKLVKGSDMDIVVIADNLFPKRLLKRLDEEIYMEKYRLLVTPHLREEIDYVVKDLNRVKEQMAFKTFKQKVACKILQEGAFLFGSDEVFFTVKSMLKEYGVTEKISAMEEEAMSFRKRAEDYLMRTDPQKVKDESLNLFYPSDESEEFE